MREQGRRIPKGLRRGGKGARHGGTGGMTGVGGRQRAAPFPRARAATRSKGPRNGLRDRNLAAGVHSELLTARTHHQGPPPLSAAARRCSRPPSGPPSRRRARLKPRATGEAGVGPGGGTRGAPLLTPGRGLAPSLATNGPERLPPRLPQLEVRRPAHGGGEGLRDRVQRQGESDHGEGGARGRRAPRREPRPPARDPRLAPRAPRPQEIAKLAEVIEEEEWLFAKPRHTYEARRR